MGAIQDYIARYNLFEIAIISVVGIVLGVTMMLRLNIVIANGVGCLFMLAIGWISKMVPIVPVTQISPAIATRMVWH